MDNYNHETKGEVLNLPLKDIKKIFKDSID